MEDEEIQSNINQKQQYLRDEIMNKNYDIDEFSEFMSQYKENGLDLINWTFDELKDAVYKFKNKNKIKSREEEEQIIEKGVENVRQSYIFNQIEYPNLDIDNKDENSINNNNININYDYNMINYNNLQNTNSIIFNGKKEINKKELNKEEKLPNIDSQLNKETLNESENNEISQNIQSNNSMQKTDNKHKDSEFEILDENYINNDEKIKERIQCIKQIENSLTKNNNLYVNLES